MGMQVLSMKCIHKEFPGTVALDQVDFWLNQGEILSMLGENGAGKTTLMKILYGMIQPDRGTICYKGKNLTIKSPAEAIKLGICMVHQHFMLVPALTVTENIIAADEPRKGMFLDMRTARKRVGELIVRFAFNMNPDSRVAELSVGEQQRVEILKAVYRNADILILDEPTAVLTPREVEELFIILEQLRSQGKSIIIITHKLKETMAIADRICVLRDGRMIRNDVTPAESTIEQLSEMMVGRKVEMNIHRKAEHVGGVRLSVKNLNLCRNGHMLLDHIEFNIHEGEILGIAGIEGNGQSQLLESLTGLCTPDTMDLTVNGKPLSGNVYAFLRRRIGHVPEDRQTMGLVVQMGMRENCILGYHREEAVCRNGILKSRQIGAFAARCKEDYLVKVPSIDTPVKAMSGGNQQKVVIARTFSHNPDVLVIAHPTRGVDVGAMEYIHHQLLALRDQGKAVLLISADLDEVRSLSDRLMVLYDGKIVARCRPDEYTEVQLGMLMTGNSLESVREVRH